MIRLVELMVELDKVFDNHAKDGLEPVYLHVNGQLIPLASMTIEADSAGARRLVLKGEVQ